MMSASKARKIVDMHRMIEEREAEIERLRAALAHCGGENCMGRRCDDVTNWVTEQAAQARVAAERGRHADALRCALEALDYCIEDSAELLNERTVQWGSFRNDRQAAMAATLERHRAVAERMRAMLKS